MTISELPLLIDTPDIWTGTLIIPSNSRFHTSWRGRYGFSWTPVWWGGKTVCPNWSLGTPLRWSSNGEAICISRSLSWLVVETHLLLFILVKGKLDAVAQKPGYDPMIPSHIAIRGEWPCCTWLFQNLTSFHCVPLLSSSALFKFA